VLRGFGPSESALTREGLLLGITVSKVGGCSKVQDGAAKTVEGDPRTAEGARNPKVASAPEGLRKLPKVT